jgi:hypothetical protein
MHLWGREERRTLKGLLQESRFSRGRRVYSEQDGCNTDSQGPLVECICGFVQNGHISQIEVTSYTGRAVVCSPPQLPVFKPEPGHVRFAVDRATLGQVFSMYFCFPCHSCIPLIVLQSSPSIIQGWFNRTINVRINSRLGSNPAKYVNKIT